MVRVDVGPEYRSRFITRLEQPGQRRKRAAEGLHAFTHLLFEVLCLKLLLRLFVGHETSIVEQGRERPARN